MLAFIPRLILFVVVLAIGYLIAEALGKVLVEVIERVGFERVVVAVGGGGIVPMRARWEKVLDKVEAEAPAARREVENTGDPVDAIRDEAQQYRS